MPLAKPTNGSNTDYAARIGALFDAVNDGTGLTGSWTPTISASSGTITTSSASGTYIKVGNRYFFNVAITITANGTGAGVLQFTIPVTASATTVGCGRAEAVSGKQLQARVLSGSATMIVANYDGTYPAVSGESLLISGTFM
jgi:hypothetical protein